KLPYSPRLAGGNRPSANFPRQAGGYMSVRKRGEVRAIFFSRFFAGEFAVQPSAGVGPEAVGAARREAEGLGGFRNAQAGEVAQLDQPGRLRIHGGEARQSVVKGQEVFARLRGGDAVLGELLAHSSA